MSLLFVPSLGFKHFLQLSCFQKQRSFSLGPCKYSLYQVKPIIWKVNRSVACVDVPLKKASERQTGVADTLYHNAEALETKIVIDNEKDFYHSIISVRCKDRPGLLKDLTYCLETAGITVERALVKTESQLALDTFFVTDSGSKIAEEDFEKIEHIITQTLESKKGANTTINWVPLAGKKVYVQNRNNPLYTTVTLTAPNIPGNTRQDVFHVTSMEGKQLDEATCNEIVNMAYFMLSTPQVEEDSY
ncbi:hypothetical protein Gasu2_48080 [Galdieria sulphuraria]|nr:hypothetical protein Gasu2_48080 [Galdieria sulphuraria]